MLEFDDWNGGVVCIPWHAIQMIRLTKRFPIQPELQGLFQPARPLYLLNVNGMVVARYADYATAVEELFHIQTCYCQNKPYRIWMALTREEYEQLISSLQEESKETSDEDSTVPVQPRPGGDVPGHSG